MNCSYVCNWIILKIFGPSEPEESSFLLLESGDFLLQETGDKIELE